MVRIVASAELPCSPKEAIAILLDPTNMSKWLTGAQGLKADSTWPFFNTSLSWETDHGSGVCSARVVDNALPEFLKVEVATPTHSRTVTHRFVATLNGTHYERVVEAELFGLSKLFGGMGLRRQIEAEVRRASALVPAPLAKKGSGKA